MISYGYTQKQKEKDWKICGKKSLVIEFTPKYYRSPPICAACKNSFGLRKQYKVFDLTVCKICANEIRLKILRDNWLDSDNTE